MKQTLRTETLDTQTGGRNEFKTGYQPKAKLIKDDKCFLPDDSHSILNTWNYNFCQFFNIHVSSDIR